MFTGINPRSATPLYVQIAESVRRSIATGEMHSGDLLPTVKAAAIKLRVNPATITQAYRELVRDGIAEQDGDGSQAVVRIAKHPRLTPPDRPGTGTGTVAGMRTVAAAALARLEPGARIDERFELRRLLGAGAMGAVYLARDLELDEDVALKILPPLQSGDETSVKRFINEIRLARRISHPNVVRTHDVGRWSGGLFLTMEYVEGRTLREEMDARGRLPESEVLAIVTQLLDALLVAHASGVIHRDIKPQNLLLDASGVLKVLDFGIAVLQGASGELTEAGLVVGTPAYMAPEQLLGNPLTPAADLYAVGIVLYEALSGTLPFSAPSPMSLVAQMVSTAPRPIRESNPQLDDRTASVVMSLLAVEPGRRPTAASLLAELRGPLSDLSSFPRPRLFPSP